MIELFGARALVDSFEDWLPLSSHALHERLPKSMNLERILAAAQAGAAG